MKIKEEDLTNFACSKTAKLVNFVHLQDCDPNFVNLAIKVKEVSYRLKSATLGSHLTRFHYLHTAFV